MNIRSIVFIIILLSSSAYGMESIQAVTQNPFEKYYGENAAIFSRWDQELEHALAHADRGTLERLQSNILDGIRIFGMSRVLKENAINLDVIIGEMPTYPTDSMIFAILKILRTPCTGPLGYEKTGHSALTEDELMCFIQKAVRPRMLELHDDKLPNMLRVASLHGLIKTVQVILPCINQTQVVGEALKELNDGQCLCKGLYRTKRATVIEYLQQQTNITKN